MKEKVIDNIKIAIRTEIDGYNFYLAASNIVTDKHGKTVFSHLSKEELEHLTVLRAISKALETGGVWLTYEDAVNEGSLDKSSAPIFMEENELIKRLKTNQTELNAVAIAVEAEEKAVDFYSRMLKDAKEVDEKTVLSKILDMERNHLKLLRWEQESIVKTGFWCDFMEFNIERELE